MWTYNQTHDYLAHHGVKGMRWGVRHDKDDKSSGKSSSSEDTSKKYQLTDKQKRNIKIGVAVAGSFIAAYGAYKLVDSGQLHSLCERGKLLLNENEGK